jgi:hypothetical protein
MKRKHIQVGRGYQISEDIKKTIINECDNPADYEQYVELNLLSDPDAGAAYYHITTDHFKFYCKEALCKV